MGRTITTEALVLKTYDIGDADRFCILLTETHGRLPVTAKGVRKPLSKWGGAMQSFRHLRIDLAEHSSGFILSSAECLTPPHTLLSDVRAFILLNEGSELLLRLLHDTEESPEIFHLAKDFFSIAHTSPSALLLPTFRLALLHLLGLLPSFRELHAAKFSPSLQSYLCSTAPLAERVCIPLLSQEREVVQELSDHYLRDHLTSPLKAGICMSAPVTASRRGSSTVTPISSILGRAS